MLLDELQAALDRIPQDGLVLDVGGWGAPVNRADWVIDFMPYETRGIIGSYLDGPERFSAETWVRRDICAREPWPFEDDQFDLVVCVTTLEDVRDPIWVCSEMSRVGKAGYLEVPTIYEELLWDPTKPYAGHKHHRWFCVLDHERQAVEFVHKSHDVHHDRSMLVHPAWKEQMDLRDYLQGMAWEGELHASERLSFGEYDLGWLREAVRERFGPPIPEIGRAHLAALRARSRAGAVRRRLRTRMRGSAAGRRSSRSAPA